MANVRQHGTAGERRVERFQRDEQIALRAAQRSAGAPLSARGAAPEPPDSPASALVRAASARGPTAEGPPAVAPTPAQFQPRLPRGLCPNCRACGNPEPSTGFMYRQSVIHS